MTYPNATPPKHNDDDNFDEASSLLTIATAAPTSSVSFGQEGMPAKKKKKNGGAPMRAMIATTCFFLGILAVIYGGSGSSSNNTHRTDGTTEALLLGQNQAALEYPSYYDPSTDFCFWDADANILCWIPPFKNCSPYPRRQWRDISDRALGVGNCGDRCTTCGVSIGGVSGGGVPCQDFSAG